MRLSPRYGGEPVLHFAPLIASTVEPAHSQRQRLLDSLEALPEDAWQSPSRCEGWSTADVVAHLISVNRFWVHTLDQAARGEQTRLLEGFDPATSPGQLIVTNEPRDPRALLDAFASGHLELTRASKDIATLGLDTLAEAPPGHIGARAVIAHGLWDSWIHERDIFVPLGHTPERDDTEIETVLVYAAALSPALLATMGSTRKAILVVQASAPEVTISIEFGSVVTVRPGATPQATLTIEGDAIELIEAFTLRRQMIDVDPEVAWMLGGMVAAFSAT